MSARRSRDAIGGHFGKSDAARWIFIARRFGLIAETLALQF
jgi:hypothetical protein